MKKFIFSSLLSLALYLTTYSNGVVVADARNAVYFRMDSTIVNVNIESQIATTVTTQYFTNTLQTGLVKYCFPLPEQASATRLRWKINGVWYDALIAGTGQDTTLPGPGGTHANLLAYLGKTPLYFSIPQQVVANSQLVVELTYVELLPYKFGVVSYNYQSDYHLIQNSVISSQKLNFILSSPRTIDSLKVVSSHPVEIISNNGNTAIVKIALYEQLANKNYSINYSLSLSQLGLYCYSSFQNQVPDTYGKGFMTFIAEPDPSATTSAISKVFTLIIDRSGSMSGNKITQAKDAAKFIVNNLNAGDRFNLIDFDDIITSFKPGHVTFTTITRDSALLYINNLDSRGLTNISGAFATAIPQFAAANDSTANIIIFLTDGQPTAGITDIQQLVSYINNLMTTTERNICLFSFGIGADVNKQLLTLISSQNKGFAEFLGNDELYSRITGFYQSIRNPVLLNSKISFTPAVISEVYPDSLPNLYKGNQMIVAGRYNTAGPVQIKLSGSAYGKPVNYIYNLQLSDSSITSNQFLPKIWAKRKIESLLVKYYSLNPNSPEAAIIKTQIIDISKAYGVITVFTSFSGSTGVEDKIASRPNIPFDFELLGNYPNPFNPTTTIQVKVNVDYFGPIEIRIYNLLGQLVRVLKLHLNGKGVYNLNWDGLDSNGDILAGGAYFYGVELNNNVLVGKMNLLK